MIYIEIKTAGLFLRLSSLTPASKSNTNLSINAEMFSKRYSKVSEGSSYWKKIKTTESNIYNWDDSSTYVKKPPFFDNLTDNSLVVPRVRYLCVVRSSVCRRFIVICLQNFQNFN